MAMTDTEADLLIDELVDLKAKLEAADILILDLREDARLEAIGWEHTNSITDEIHANAISALSKKLKKWKRIAKERQEMLDWWAAVSNGG